MIINTNFNNIIEGDNKLSLTKIKEEEIKVDLIYIDPPYNTGKNTFRYSDNSLNWGTIIKNRLSLARDVMHDHASIFISIDDNEYHTLRMVCDEVFGKKNFVANFIWKKSHTVKNDKVGISTQHEYILCYAKDSPKVFFNREKTGDDYIKKAYRYKDNVGNFRVVPLFKPKNPKSFLVTSPNGNNWVKNWNYNEEGFKSLIDNDLIYWGKNGDACPTKKVYLKEVMDKTFGTILDPKKVGYTGSGAKALEALGFEKTDFIYTKPVELIAHILDMASTPNSLVLDFFAGSGTTAESVFFANKQDNGNRKFILCNNNENNICEKITYPRVSRAKENYGDTTELKYTKLDPDTILEKE
jgi:adenine-specific DNA-methyltransferase